jgi:hypothetical protein
MYQRRGFHRWLATATFLIGVAVSTGPAGHAQPGDDVDDTGAASSADPLPPPSDDLAGKKPPADTLPPARETPYPDFALIVTAYERRPPEEFFTASNYGVWFTNPLGLNCGIFDTRGSFGCSGDIRGAPEGTTEIGWLKGNIVTRYDAYDPLLRASFPTGRAERMLPPRSYVEYNGTRCATMADTSTYCTRGPFQFMITPTKTYLSPP